VSAVERPSGRIASDLGSGELAWIVNQLPIAMFVHGRDLKVRLLNFWAQRLSYTLGVRVRTGDTLPDVGQGPSLHELASQLFRSRMLMERRLEVGERTLLVQGFASKDDDPLGVLLIEDATRQTRRLQAETDFLVNASHEFLSPLTSIAAAAHVLGEGADDPAVRAQFVGNIVEASNRLIATSRALLVLARGEAGAEPPRLELVDLKALLDEVFTPDSLAGCELSLTCPNGALVLADRDLLSLALAALRDNACRHGGHAPIHVEVAELDGGAVTSIEIGGTGGAVRGDIDLARLTERFVSGEGRDSGGFGIGLSIAERATRLVGGRLRFRQAADGLRARLDLPAGRVAP
jgi:signal transduction histidine kinase